MKKSTGYFYGISAAVSYGTNPLFALPMFAQGYEVNSVLFYRYFFAIIIYGCLININKKVSLKISVKEGVVLFLLAIIFSLSSLFLFEAFNYMEAGLACTILFAYPLIVAIISGVFFKEKIPLIVWFAILAVICGIAFLYTGKPDEYLSTKGIIFVLLSSLSYSIYMVSVKQSKIAKRIKPDTMTFYIMAFGLFVYIWNLRFCTLLQPLNNPVMFICALLLALFPTIISLEAITISIKIIGATKTAILGALEPLTALFIGITLFGEVLTAKIIFGIILILSGVILVISAKKS